jgi:hypothetical protein
MEDVPGVVAQLSSLVPEDGVVPLWMKIAHTLFLTILIPAYWRKYGPANFLWFSDIALLVTLPALWLESPLLASMEAVSVALLDLIWCADFLVGLLARAHPVGLSKYMFDPKVPLWLRGLSLFHCWLPIQLLWLVGRLGYDGRALFAQTALAWVVLPVCYFFTAPAENINWVFGPGGAPQQRMAPGRYLLLLMLFFPVCVYLPTHLVLQAVFPGP